MVKHLKFIHHHKKKVFVDGRQPAWLTNVYILKGLRELFPSEKFSICT